MKLKSRGYVCNSYTIKKVITFGGVKVAFFCFKQLPLILNKIWIFVPLIEGERLLSVVVGVVIFLAELPDFNYSIFSLSPSLFKV